MLAVPWDAYRQATAAELPADREPAPVPDLNDFWDFDDEEEAQPAAAEARRPLRGATRGVSRRARDRVAAGVSRADRAATWEHRGGRRAPARSRQPTRTDRCATDARSRRERSWCHRPGAHPQLLHHRPHRPRQVDAGRPDAAAHRRGRRPADARAVPRPDGHRARARHHHQEPGRPDAVDGPRGRPDRRAGRAQHDRHPGPRRLHLRGVPRRWPPARARCCWSTPRRASRRRPWPTSTWRSRTTCTIIPVLNKIDLPAAQPEKYAEELAHLIGCEPDGLPAGLRQDRRRRAAPARRDRPAVPAPGRRRRRAGPRDDLRLGLRRLPRRGHLRPGHRRPDRAPATGSR